MILTVDIGNSNIVLGGFQNDEITFKARVRTETAKTADQYCVDLKILLDLYGVQKESIQGAIIGSVVPQVLNAFRTAVERLIGKPPLVVGPGLKTGLDIRLDHPTQTGADLVAGNVAALREHKPPLIVIDMSTATTMAVMDASGAHIGGVIMPGVKISMEALRSRTALLPGLQLEKPKAAIGRNTVDAMQSGVMLGAACMLDGMIERIQQELHSTAAVVATGGIAGYVVPLCKTPILYDRDLVLKGLYILYQENT